MSPRLKVGLNKEFDKLICGKFINRKKGGIDFGEGIVKVHPKLFPEKVPRGKKSNEIISNYFDSFYKRHNSDLLETVKESQDAWNNISPSFYKACDLYFNGHPWPKGKYFAYLSIINCNPRFLGDKTFQVYWKHEDGFVFVAVHEMLHFLFFDLMEKLLPNIDIKSEKAWKISEVFNGLIMNEPEFVEITGKKDSGQYPNLIQLQKQLQKVWNSNKKADRFLLSTLT